jgi:electron transfer flavoprotein alpha subunit
VNDELWVAGELKAGALHPASAELLGKAGELAKSRGGGACLFLCGADAKAAIDEGFSFGAEKIYWAGEKNAGSVSAHVYARILARSAANVRAVLMAATVFGRAAMPQAAALLGTGLTADCTALEIRDGELIQIRPAFSGGLLAEIAGTGALPLMATVRPGIFPLPPREPGRRGTLVSLFPEPEPDPFTLIGHSSTEAGDALADAAVILAGGMGAGREGFALMEEIAVKTGCALGASRAVVNAGLAPYAMQIGQTGRTVRPKLYIACGISGEIQHLAGMSASEYIVAVNTDRKAPIFDYADYGYAGDCVSFLTKLKEYYHDGSDNKQRLREPPEIHSGSRRI